MNSKRVIILMPVLAMLMFTTQALSGDSMVSLRGMTAIEDPSPQADTKALKTDRTTATRNFALQPPLIPHPTKAYKINQQLNKCLSCHGRENFEEKEATKISETHYKDRDGVELTEVSSSRYFCNLCHVEQFDVEPLIENNFKSLEAAK